MAGPAASDRVPNGQRRQAFAAVWAAAASPADAAARLGLSVRSAYSRASYLRNRGLAVKKFPTGPKPRPGPKPAAPPPPPRRTPAAFAAVWNRSASVGDAARQLGLARRSASTLACLYWKAGLALKRFATRGPSPGG